MEEAADPVCPAFNHESADIMLRSGQVYGSDSSTVLQEPALFRLQRSFLSRISPVFRDMFVICDDSQGRSPARAVYTAGRGLRGIL